MNYLSTKYKSTKNKSTKNKSTKNKEQKTNQQSTNQQRTNQQINKFSPSPPNFSLLPFNFLLGSFNLALLTSNLALLPPMDFTFKTYEKLLNTLLTRGFSFITFAQYMELKTESENNPSQPFSNLKPRTPNAEPPTHQQINKEQINNFESLNPESLNLIILRHDVEARYPNALRMAQIQHKLGIKGSYYFRIFSKPCNETIIKQIASLGHEIGYHYDDLSVCNGNHQKALERFRKNLAYLRQFAPVQTICMEGAPESKYNNQDLWKKYDYRDFGITSEPYFDLDFNKVYYLTDTGRRWDGKFSVRDKPIFKDEHLRNERVSDEFRYRHTKDIIKAIEKSSFPDSAMLTFHPQRWNDKPLPWLKELLWQNVKNQVKRIIIKRGN